ncbi:hypothetical protein [Algoriphagus sediminis]|uniref:Uncharacterized protein n=1 Tax=Algoriphagus sediminis TaxID=3057113 RepID=A0ABT7Y892_9BACT|nr:hypothetical protein [Algoriphagus sediminis]MDN3202747.1 hypothetical protein [Algoriphagus sediminis]
MKTPPESFLLFKEELKKLQLEKDRLGKQYEMRIAELNAELCRLKEQISSQQDMLKTTLDYASQLENDLDKFKEEISESKEQRRNGVY